MFHLQNCTPNYTSILPDDINCRTVIWSSRLSRFGGGITYTQLRQEWLGKAQGRFQLESQPHLPTSPQEQRKNNKIDHFGPIFQFRPGDDHAPPKKKNLVPPLPTLKSSAHCIQIIPRGKVWGPWRPLDQFNFNQLAQVLYHLTQLILSCAVNHGTRFN